MFFKFKKEDATANNLFKKNCTYHGLRITLSLKAIVALKHVVHAGLKNEPVEISERDMHTLWRRGFIRLGANGEPIVTEAGLLAVAFCEASGLMTFRSAKEKTDDEAS